MIEDYPLAPGYQYPEWETVVTAERQRVKHRCCDIDPAVYGDRADIAFLAYDSIMTEHRAGVSIDGGVHMYQALRQFGPVHLDEPLTVHGRITAVDPAPRGNIVRATFEFRRRDGSVAVAAERAGLRPSANATRKGPAGGKRRKSAAPDTTGMRRLLHKQLMPEKVAAFSSEAENLIHSDPDVARERGFRAPIAGGLMAVHFMLEALCENGVPDRLDMEARFLRPMFWDDALDLMGRENPNQPGRISEMRLINTEGKATSACTVNDISRG